MIVAQVSLLVVGLWIASVESQTSAELKCVTNNKAAKLSINNWRNQTGHVISKVTFEHSGPKTKNGLVMTETNLWTVDVEQRAESCEGVEYTTYVAFTIIAPSYIRQPAPGYELFPGIGYYKFHTNVTTWPRAREICAEEGAHLVIINSEEESDVTKKLFSRHPTITGISEKGWAWVGVREDDQINNQYWTIFGVPLNSTGFSRWISGQPNNIGTGDYVLTTSTGGLADIDASGVFKQPFICEQDLW